MVSQINSNELYNLRWNSYFSNLINVFTDHQRQEALVDVTLGCEGQFIKAHKLVLSACSVHFQKIFETHTNPQLLILLNDVKFKDLQLVVQFMYKGEVKVADSDMQQFLALGKMLQVKGLCSVELQDKQKLQSNGTPKDTNAVQEPPATPEKSKISENKKTSCNQIVQIDLGNKTKEVPAVAKKRKLPSPVPPDNKKKNGKPTPTTTETPETSSHIPRPPNAFMIFANQWRKKLAVEYPNESNKDISVRLGNMWKSLSPETKEAFYEDARKADEEHKLKYPGYYYSPKEARHKKAIANLHRAVQKLDTPPNNGSVSDNTSDELIEIKFEDNDSGDGKDVATQSNGTN